MEIFCWCRETPSTMLFQIQKCQTQSTQTQKIISTIIYLYFYVYVYSYVFNRVHVIMLYNSLISSFNIKDLTADWVNARVNRPFCKLLGFTVGSSHRSLPCQRQHFHPPIGWVSLVTKWFWWSNCSNLQVFRNIIQPNQFHKIIVVFPAKISQGSVRIKKTCLATLLIAVFPTHPNIKSFNHRSSSFQTIQEVIHQITSSKIHTGAPCLQRKQMIPVSWLHKPDNANLIVKHGRTKREKTMACSYCHNPEKSYT